MIRESDIVHENGDVWVLREAVGYVVYRAGATHSVRDSLYPRTDDGLSIAVARCDYLTRRPDLGARDRARHRRRSGILPTKMKKLRVDVVRSEGVTSLGHVCPTCGREVRRDRSELWAYVEEAWKCVDGHEVAVTLNGDTATVRLPLGADAWSPVESSNLAAVGRIRDDLLVRFKRDARTYRYVGAGASYDAILAARSAGSTFTSEVRRKFEGVALCSTYGCGRRTPCDFHP